MKRDRSHEEYGMFETSDRYCIKCKTNTKFMFNADKGHSECLVCGNTWSKRLRQVDKDAILM